MNRPLWCCVRRRRLHGPAASGRATRGSAQKRARAAADDVLAGVMRPPEPRRGGGGLGAGLGVMSEATAMGGGGGDDSSYLIASQVEETQIQARDEGVPSGALAPSAAAVRRAAIERALDPALVCRC